MTLLSIFNLLLPSIDVLGYGYMFTRLIFHSPNLYRLSQYEMELIEFIFSAMKESTKKILDTYRVYGLHEASIILVLQSLMVILFICSIYCMFELVLLWRCYKWGHGDKVRNHVDNLNVKDPKRKWYLILYGDLLIKYLSLPTTLIGCNWIYFLLVFYLFLQLIHPAMLSCLRVYCLGTVDDTIMEERLLNDFAVQRMKILLS